MKKWSLILAGVLLLITGDLAHSQLLYKEGMVRENYGRSGYQKYARSIINKSANPRYDEFGNYVMDGVRVYEWVEEKRNSKHIATGEAYSSLYKTNYVDDGEYFREYLNNLVVIRESQKAFSSRFIVGNELRVKFSPLVMDMAAMSGIRWDINYDDTNFTFISSRSDVPLYFSRAFINPDLQSRLLPVYLTGAHFERKVGIFNIAASYVNQYRSDTSQSRQKNSITGTLPYYAGDNDPSNPNYVKMMVVQVEDGSRFDGDGPRIYDMYPVISGQKRPELLIAVTETSYTEEYYGARYIDKYSTQFYENRYFIEPHRAPHHYDFVNPPSSNSLIHYIMKRNVSDPMFRNFGDFTTDSKEYLEADGEKILQFWFEIPSTTEEITDVEFWSMIGNDYKISVSEIYYDKNSKNNNLSASYFSKVLEASGNVKDLSNLKWVRFKYGRQTSNMLMGLKMDSHIQGFDFVAEYNKNMSFRQFYHTKADKFREDDEAYYINVKKEIGKFTIGTEYFDIGSDYSTQFESIDKNYYDLQKPSFSSWYEEYHKDLSLGGGGTAGSVDPLQYMNNTMLLNTVDDNDDKDQFPDYHMYSFVRDRNGIFPGLDKNGNNRPDTNENDNLIPDYAEPFLLYYVEPEEFDYGDDFNQNGIIDAREDDDRPDYPYEIDTKGYHVFGSYGEDTGMKYTLGVIDFEQPMGGGITDVKYGKVEYYKYIPFYADVNFASTFKKVEDSIQDHTFQHARQLSTTLVDSFTYVDNAFYSREGIQHEVALDQLDYRDSYVSSSYLETKLFRIPNLTVNMKFIYDINHQNETSYQAENDIIERAQVVKADYQYYWKNLLIMPQVKFMNRKMTSTNRYFRPYHEQYFYPIIRVEYPLTMNTTLKAGAQGFPGLNSTVRNLVNDQLDYDQRNYLIMLSNRSLYNGYDFNLNFGYQVFWQDLHGVMRQSYSRTDKVLFIRLIVGMEPIS